MRPHGHVLQGNDLEQLHIEREVQLEGAEAERGEDLEVTVVDLLDPLDARALPRRRTADP